MRIAIHRPGQASTGNAAPAPDHPGVAARLRHAPPAGEAPGVQRDGGEQALDPERVHEAGRLGTGGAGGPLPHLDKIQKAFGAHDVSAIVAHTDPAAEEGARAMGATAFTMGEHVAFAGEPSLYTAAHEAAHVVQQRAGVELPGGVGQAGDPYERHADAVAARVVRGEPAEELLAATPGRARAKGAVQRARSPVIQASAPLADAVAAVRALGPGAGSRMVTSQLVLGLREAEGEFLRTNPFNRWGEALGLAGTVGPGQLGEPAIRSVDRGFGAAAAQFAAVHGAAPGSWQEKATHAAWSYFYIAAYLAFSINEAERVFQGTPPAMSSSAIGILPLGIAIYHGAFETIRAMRRRIAAARGVAPSSVSWQMVEEELRSGTPTPEERSLERYTMLAAGSWQIGFEIQAATLSRRFDVGGGGRVRATILADYRSPTPVSAGRTSVYTIELRKIEIAQGHGGAVGEGYNIIGSRRLTVSRREVAEWTGLNAGTYQLHIRKEESTYSADVLVGQGTVETIY